MKKKILLLIGFLILFSTFYSFGQDEPEYGKYLKLGQNARIEGNIEQSIVYLQKCRNHVVTLYDSMRVYNSLGGSYHKLSDFHIALTYYDSTKAILDSAMYPMLHCFLMNNYAIIYMDIQKFSEAIVLFKSVLNCINEKNKGIIFYNIAQCYNFLENYQEATKYYRLAHQNNHKNYGDANYYTTLSGLKLAKLGEFNYHTLFPSIIKLNNDILRGIYYQIDKQYEKAENCFRTDKDCMLDLYCESGQWIKAVRLIDTIRKTFISLQSKLFLQKNESFIYKNAIEELLKTDTLEAFKIAQKSNSNILRDMANFSSTWKKNSYSYFDFDSVIYLFHTVGLNTSCKRIRSKQEFWEQYRIFLESITDNNARGALYHRNYKDFCTAGTYLFNKLVPSISKDMLIIPSGRLQNLPFECLPIKMPSDTSLPDYKSIDYLLKTSVVHYDYILRDYKRSKRHRSIVALAPDTALTYATEEIKPLWAFRANRFIGNQAKRRYVLEGDILHISTHYDPASFKIQFADSIMFLNELPKIKRDLVILSTCKSGIGDFHSGEGTFSPGRAFYVSQSESVIESAWNASDGQSYYIIWNFYKQLFTGKNKADALRRAKLKYLASCPDYMSAPYYWGNYRVFGNNSALKLKLNILIPVSAFAFFLILVILLKNIFSRSRVNTFIKSNSI